MNKAKQVRKDRDGAVLIVTMCLLFIVAGMVITILDVACDHRAIAVKQLNMDQAMYVAEGGVETGARFMESNLTVMVNSSTGATNGSGNVGSGSYSYYVYRTNTSTYCIVSTGTVNGVTRIVSLMDVYQPTYAQFALWSHLNEGLYFGSGETYNGHVHADDELYFTGSPAFYAPLTSDYGTYSGSLSTVYTEDGLTLNSYQGTMADVNFNSGSSSLKSEATSGGGVVVSGTATLTFNGGTVTVKTTSSNQTYTIPAGGGIIYVANVGTSTSGSQSGTIYLEGGAVTGPLTVASEASMYIENNITYTHNPVTTPTSTDALGLISQNNIWVDTPAPNNLTIDAAMIAAGTSSGGTGSFGAINYTTRSAGTLTIYGGIVQEERGAVCLFNSGGSVIDGYDKKYSYDPRFLTKPPPYYPVIAGKVNFSQWQEQGNGK
jgi:hypothetical protein